MTIEINNGKTSSIYFSETTKRKAAWSLQFGACYRYGYSQNMSCLDDMLRCNWN